MGAYSSYILEEKLVMAKDIPDYMRGFDLNDDWGFVPVSSKPKESKPGVDEKQLDSKFEGTNIELAKVKTDVSSIKSMMNEVMQIVAEKDTITKEITNEEVKGRFKEIEKIMLPFLYNLSKSEEPYIHWPNRGPIIKAQIEKILKLTRG
tara:strand:- start:287 stop:733 length:447 start_codon:yes stop_codon:yes gene_type:complete